jgi:adenylosuccinate synthase
MTISNVKTRVPSAKPIILVQGAQWGSEAKGTVAAHLCVQRNISYAVRTGGVNAGHTVIFNGRTHKMQQLPTGWINQGTRLVLGAGAYIHPEILAREIEEIDSVMGKGTTARRLYIDFRAGLHAPKHQTEATSAGRHVRLGATGKGVSEAIVDKIARRGQGALNFLDYVKTHSGAWNEITVLDTSEMLNRMYNQGAGILLEGTQGHYLDLHYGPWPYTTGKQTLAATWLAEAGLSPRLDYEIVSVVRTYPIRVAGNSGPMADEISWPILAREINVKLERWGLDPVVKDGSIAAFEQAVIRASNLPLVRLPPNSDGLDQHLWATGDRLEYAAALSDLNAHAMETLKIIDRAAYDDCCHFFERTTVTQKLRRIARISTYDLSISCLRDRPSWLAVTFLNYEFPHLWNGDTEMLHHHWSPEINGYLRNIARRTGTPIGMVSTGPLLNNLINIHIDGEA